jgi:hypothetical protein
LGELVRDPSAADRVVDDYLALAAALPAPPADAWLAVDLTHLALDVDPAGSVDRLAAIAAALPPGRRVQVGAEDAARTDAVLKRVMDVAGRGWADRLGATVQANLLRSPADVDELIESGVHVRLVKGAYVEASGAHPYGEATDVAPPAHLRVRSQAQSDPGDALLSVAARDPSRPPERGPPSGRRRQRDRVTTMIIVKQRIPGRTLTVRMHPAMRWGDVAYLRLGFRLAERGATWSMATHDDRIREALLLGLGTVTVEQLLGVRPQVLEELQQRAVPTRVYVPYGGDWFRYWMRRLAESRGARLRSPTAYAPACGAV